MKGIQKEFEEYLHRTGALEPVRLGGDEGIHATREDSTKLARRLRAKSKLNDRLVLLLAAMYAVLFGTGIWLVFSYLDKPDVLPVVFGGTFLSLLPVIGAAQKLWRNTTVMELTAKLVDDLPPEQAVQIVLTLHSSGESR